VNIHLLIKDMSRPITKLPEIESSAIRLFATHGLAQVTIKEIAKQARCAEGALYRHYSSKEEMAWVLFKREVEKFAGRVRKVWSLPGSCSRKLRKGIELFYKFFDEDPLAFAFILLTQHDFPAEKKLNPELRPDELVLFLVKHGVQSGEFRIPDPELGAAMVLGAVLEPPTLHAKGKLKGPMRARSRTVSDACLRILKARTGSKQMIFPVRTRKAMGKKKRKR
jgi:AcrR family transcriptional regulator